MVDRTQEELRRRLKAWQRTWRLMWLLPCTFLLMIVVEVVWPGWFLVSRSFLLLTTLAVVLSLLHAASLDD